MNANNTAIKTVYMKEVYRFSKVYNQTLLAPLVSAMLFFVIFKLYIGYNVSHINNVTFDLFILSGLSIMTSIQNSFACSSSVITMGKVLGHITDYLVPPLKNSDIIIGMTLASTTRGVIICILVLASGRLFVDFTIEYPLYCVVYLILANIFLALLGMMAGFFSETFDQISAITSYIITPLAFLSGTFYSIDKLPEFWQKVNIANPFFYIIDGFRYGITGYSDITNPSLGIIYISCIIIIMYPIVDLIIKTGYKIKQ